MKRRNLDAEGFIVGANYWASHAAHKMWEIWDPDTVDKDMALAEKLGLNAIRSFFWTPQLNPFPGVIDTSVLDRFEEFLSICASHGIRVFPSIFVGHMSGTNWDIPWRQGRDFCADPYMIYWETDLVRKIVSRFRGNNTIYGWILSNELPNYTGSMSAETATVWTRAMYQAIREEDPEALVGTGDGARCEVRPDYDGFRVEWIKDHVDWFGVHLYNYFHFEKGDNDELRKSYHIPCRLRYVDIDNKPVMLEEFGLSDLIAGKEEAAGYYRSVLYSSLVNGSCGCMAWSLTDFDLPEEPPYEYQPHELVFGIADAKWNVKPQGKVLADFSSFIKSMQIDGYQPAKSECAIFVPYFMYEDHTSHSAHDRLRTYRMLEESFTLAKMAGLDPDFLRDIHRLSEYRFLLMPGGIRLKSPQWVILEEWVQNGGVLYYSYFGVLGGVYAQNFQNLFGCRQHLRYGLISQSEEETVTLQATTRFGSFAEGDRIQIPRGPLGRESGYLPLEPTAARVIMTDSQGHPAVIVNETGKGKVILSAYPAEYMLINSPEANASTRLHDLYLSCAGEAGMEVRFKEKHPSLETGLMIHETEDKELLVVINHSFAPVKSNLFDSLRSEELAIDLEMKGVCIFSRKGDEAWSPIPLES